MAQKFKIGGSNVIIRASSLLSGVLQAGLFTSLCECTKIICAIFACKKQQFNSNAVLLHSCVQSIHPAMPGGICADTLETYSCHSPLFIERERHTDLYCVCLASTKCKVRRPVALAPHEIARVLDTLTSSELQTGASFVVDESPRRESCAQRHKVRSLFLSRGAIIPGPYMWGSLTSRP
jgi:hypothetical protein